VVASGPIITAPCSVRPALGFGPRHGGIAGGVLRDQLDLRPAIMPPRCLSKRPRLDLLLPPGRERHRIDLRKPTLSGSAACRKFRPDDPHASAASTGVTVILSGSLPVRRSISA